MADIVINGATYKDVPSIEVPSSDGGMAEFEATDITDAIMTRTITNYSNSRISSLGNYALCQCESLSSVDLKSVTTIGRYGMYGCENLSSLIIRGSTVCVLFHLEAISASGISSKNGFIYVPSDLVESYKTATNWTRYASQFRALEDYTVDGTITGELDESKI